MTWAYCDECGQYREVKRMQLGEQPWNFQEVCSPCAAATRTPDPPAADRLPRKGPSPLLHSDPEPAPKCKGEAR